MLRTPKRVVSQHRASVGKAQKQTKAGQLIKMDELTATPLEQVECARNAVATALALVAGAGHPLPGRGAGRRVRPPRRHGREHESAAMESRKTGSSRTWPGQDRIPRMDGQLTNQPDDQMLTLCSGPKWTRRDFHARGGQCGLRQTARGGPWASFP